MKQLLVLLFAFLLTFPVTAKDFGVQGHTFEIAEPDLLKQITSRLKRLEGSGDLQKHQQEIARKAEYQVSNPLAVPNVIRATTARTFFYDPSVRVPFDLHDHAGRVFHTADTTFNPLKYRTLSSPLVFIDGRDSAQISWAHQILILDPRAKMILTSGSPFELMEAWGKPVYFDQSGKLTTKLGIKQTPAVVTQADLKLKIEEMVIEESAETKI